jgi:hypothetical protein
MLGATGGSIRSLGGESFLLILFFFCLLPFLLLGPFGFAVVGALSKLALALLSKMRENLPPHLCTD